MAGYIIKFINKVKNLDKKGNIKPRVNFIKIAENNWLEDFTDLTLINNTNIARRTEVAQGDLLNFFKN